MAYTKGSKLRAKRAARENGLGLPELQPIPRAFGKAKYPRRIPTRSTDDEATAALRHRCLRAGKEPTVENIREMRAPWWGCCAGRVIAEASMAEQERKHLWDAIQHMRKATVAYDAAMGAPRRHAVCLRLLAPTDNMSADASSPALDERSDAERERHAVSAIMQIEGWLGYTDKEAASEAKRVVLDDVPAHDAIGMLSALRCVSDGITGKRMMWRGK